MSVLEERMQQLKERIQRGEQEQSRFPDGPQGWEEKFIILPDETPWWRIDGRKERKGAFGRQWMRMQKKLYPRYTAEAMIKFRKEHPGYDVESSRRYNEKYPGRKAESMRKFQEDHPGYFVEKAREYQKEHPGRKAESMRKFHGNHPERVIEMMRKYDKNHPERRAEALRRFYKTPKGKLSRAEQRAQKRELITDPATYAKRKQQLHDNKEPCAVCGAPYEETHAIDHIISLGLAVLYGPRALADANKDENLRPICFECHIEKTAEDIKEQAAAKRAMTEQELPADSTLSRIN